MKLLEKTECKHILSFVITPFLEVLEKQRVLGLDIIKSVLSKMSEEKRRKALTNYLQIDAADPETVRSVVKLLEAQVDLVMLYF